MVSDVSLAKIRSDLKFYMVRILGFTFSEQISKLHPPFSSLLLIITASLLYKKLTQSGDFVHPEKHAVHLAHFNFKISVKF